MFTVAFQYHFLAIENNIFRFVKVLKLNIEFVTLQFYSIFFKQHTSMLLRVFTLGKLSLAKHFEVHSGTIRTTDIVLLEELYLYLRCI